MVGKVGNVVLRRIEVHLFVKESTRIFRQIVDPAHGNDPMYDLWPFKKKVHSMQCTKGSAAGDDRSIRRAMIADVRDHFIKDIFVELIMSYGFMSRLHFPIHPTFVVNAVNREYFQATTIDHWLQCIDELESFIFQVVCSCRRYHKQGKSIMTICRNRHIFLECRAEPTGDITLHIFSSGYKSTFCS